MREKIRQVALQRLAVVSAVALSCSVVPMGVAPASAADYVDTFNFTVDSVRCSYLVNAQLCFTGAPFQDGERVAKAGDTFTVNINFDEPFTVPGSTGASIVEALMVDATAYPGGLAFGPNTALSSLTFQGYSGDPLTVSGSQTNSLNFAYGAFAGFCCDLPTSPFTFTSARAEYEILSDAVRPLAGLAFGSFVTLDATPQVLSDFQGGHPDAPVLLPAGLVGEITGQIGGEYPAAQFYGFEWQGGIFQTQVTVTGADPSMSFVFKLSDIDGLIDSIVLNESNNFDGLLTIGSLEPGRYKIGLASSEIPDPSFTIRFLTPVGIGSGVPEPGTWAMMLLGFGAVGAAMRSRARQKLAVTYA